MTRKEALLIMVSAPVALMCMSVEPAYAMHISEGILPLPWAGFWFALAVPFVWWGLRDLRNRSKQEPHLKALLRFL